jgi:integrase
VDRKSKENEMSLRERSGLWHFRSQFRGKEYSGSTDLAATPQNMREALEIETEFFKSLKEGRRPARQFEPLTFDKALPKFLKAAETTYRSHPNSYKRIKSSLASALEFFGGTQVSEIDGARIDDYKEWRISEHEVRDITLRHDLHALSTFFQYAIRHHWASHNPIDDVDIPSDADAIRMHVLTPEEEAKYFEFAKQFPGLHDVGRLMINQGMRPEEVTTLAKADIDLEQGKIRIRRGKTLAARRTLDVTSESRRILVARMKGDSPWIFPSSLKPGCHIGRINSAHDRVVAEAAKQGIYFKLVPYDWRHTFATRAAESKIDLGTLAALLGHGSIRCVQKYVHIQEHHKKKAMQRSDQVQQRRNRRSRS